MIVDQLLNLSLETLLAAFFNTVQNNESDFVIESNFRQGRFLPMPADAYETTAIMLSKKYHLDFSVSGTRVFSVVRNPNNLSLEDLRIYLYKAIVTKINGLPLNFPLDSEIALALFIFRGSVDFNRKLYAVDLKDPSLKYVDNFFKILLSSDRLLSYLNINFRELQPQFVAGNNQRNTQIRINLKWFYDNVIERYPSINQYKTDVIRANLDNIGRETTFTMFIDRIILYKERILGRDLSQNEIDRLRRELNFELSGIDGRNQKIALYVRETFEDICVGCCDRYDISDRSFKMPRNDRYYFEINHVIPYANDAEKVDVVDNLVKLCPTCHRALTPGRAYADLQKNIIEKMLSSRTEVDSFVRSMMPSSYTSPVEFVFDSLK